MHKELFEVAQFYRNRAQADLSLAEKLEADWKKLQDNGDAGTVETVPVTSTPFIVPAMRSPAALRKRMSNMEPQIVPADSGLADSALVEAIKQALGGKNGRIGPVAKQFGLDRNRILGILTLSNGFEVLEKGWFKTV